MSGHVISATQALAELPGLHARFANSPVGLCGLLPGQTGVLQDIILDGLTRLRLLDFGFTKGTRVQLVRKGPGGTGFSPCEYEEPLLLCGIGMQREY